MTEGNRSGLSTTVDGGMRVHVDSYEDGRAEIAVDAVRVVVDPLTAAQLGDMLAATSLRAGRPLPLGLLALALQRRTDGPEPPYAPDIFGTGRDAMAGFEPLPEDLDLGDGELDALRWLLDLLDMEWSSAGVPQAVSQRDVLRRCVERHLTARSDERRLPTIGADGLSALVRLVDALAQPWVRRVLDEQLLVSTLGVVRDAVNVALIEHAHAETMWAVRRVDGESIDDDGSWSYRTDGPLDWSVVQHEIDDAREDGEHVEFEMLRLTVTPFARRSSDDDGTRLLDAALIAGGQGTLPLTGNTPCPHRCNDGLIERAATPEEVDAGCELGVAFDPCPLCNPSGVSATRT